MKLCEGFLYFCDVQCVLIHPQEKKINPYYRGGPLTIPCNIGSFRIAENAKTAALLSCGFYNKKRGEEKMKKGKKSNLYKKVLSPVPILRRVCFVLYGYDYTDKLLTIKVYNC